MPILDVEIVLRPGELLDRNLAARLADGASEIFGAPAGTTWVKLKPISAEHYAESGGGPDAGVFPVMVSVLKAKFPAKEQMQTEVAGLTALVAQIFQRPPVNVHVCYLPEAAGRIAFGGNIVPRRADD